MAKEKKKTKSEKRSGRKAKQPAHNENRKTKLKVFFSDTLFFILGSLSFSFAVNMFTAPNGIAQGGFTGLSIIINRLAGLPIGVTMICLNVPLFILSYIILGKSFILKTIIATVTTSVMIDVLAPLIPRYEGEKILAALFGGLLAGLGLGLVFVRGATTGGTDILGKLVKKYKPHMAMGMLVLIMDMVVVLASGFVFKSIESILYAIIVFFVSSRVINYLLYGTGNGKMLMVVTDKAEEIAAAITGETRRGVTLLPAKGAYTGEEKKMLLCVVRASEVAGIRKIIMRYDENPFIIISEAGEILGLGFKNVNAD